MTDRPEALRLADALDRGTYLLSRERNSTAAELRRLHEENERLHQINQWHEMKLSVRGYVMQIDDLKAANAELRRLQTENERLRLEKERWETAVRNCVAMSNGRESEWGNRAEWAFEFLYAAINKTEEDKT